MAGRILKDDIDALRQQADIVSVVGDYTTLKRAGRSFKGLCPFHTERTPSFTVTPDGNFYNCFGCGVSGDIYDFLMRIEGLEFPEAVEALARRTGVTLRYEQMSARERRAVGERSRLVEVTAAATEWFTAALFSDGGTVARDYLKDRGFGRAEADAFDLGFAPNEWESLSRALTADGFKEADLVTTGLAVRNDRGGLRDRFRGRLIFPIHDPGGDVIGFGGRVLPTIDYGDFEPPKYLNSNETPLYKKTRVLYGVPQARSEIVRAQQVLVCEGYTDVMALHQAGFANAVATCGTAVGVEHLKMIARYAGRVVLAFDGDAAGVKAAERAWEAARELSSDGDGVSLDLRVLVLPDGQDPADLARQLGADGVRQAVDGATPVVPFVLRHHLEVADLTSEGGRTAALRDALEVLGREPDPDLRREWARTEVADAVGLSYDFVARTAARQGVALDVHEGVAAATGTQPEQGRAVGQTTTARRARLERAVLRSALQRPADLPDEWFELDETHFTHPTARRIVTTLFAAGGAGVAMDAVIDAAEHDELRGMLRALALEDDPELDAVTEEELARQIVAGRVRSLLAERLQAREQELRESLARLNHATDRDRLVTIQRELQELQQRRRALQGSASEAG
ncbi:MAG: DNA primase [Nitriliruptoraceae bacterium]|nr:DNA primase [Nitriliruptoraceae bacterium]